MNEYEEYSQIRDKIIDESDEKKYNDLLNQLKYLEDFEKENPAHEDLLRFDNIKKDILEELGSLKNIIEEKYEIEQENQKKVNEINEQIEKLNSHIKGFKRKLNAESLKFTLSDELDLGVNEIIKGLHDDLKKIIDEAKGIEKEVDKIGKSESLAMNYFDINNELEELRNKLKNFKQQHIRDYNLKVVSINKKIDEFKKMEGLDAEVRAKIDRLSYIDECGYSILNWNNLSYLDKLEYSKIFEMNTLLLEIQEALNVKKDDIKEILDSKIEHIENQISDLDSKIISDIDENKIVEFREKIESIENEIDEFVVFLNNNKEKITEEEYEKYNSRVNQARENLKKLREKLNKPMVNDYDRLMDKLKEKETHIYNFASLVEALFSHVDSKDVVDALEGTLIGNENELNKIVDEIEESYKNGKLQENQYNNLMEKVEKIRKDIEDVRNKLKDPSMIKDVDIFSYLNGQIDGLENALSELETQVESLEKPIKDKNTRKNIDKIIKRLEDEIKHLESILEKHKEDDPEKYEATKERLENAKKRLDKVSKKYRSKCPLFVRAFKSAKDFFKKHKKIALIIAGLAAIALIHATVGPILIPAIMHGNIMIANTVPALRGFIKFTNGILGSMIGAVKDMNGIWTLANGVAINPSIASVSLLKGLAISGIGSAILLGPAIAGVVVAIKKLMEKMKTVDLKEKLKAEQEKLRKKVEQKKDKTGKKTKRSDKLALEELAKLVISFRKSGKTLDEFCEENGLSDEEKMIIQFLDAKSKEKENEEKKGRGK